MPKQFWFATCIVAAALSRSASAGVLVVDALNGPGTDFIAVQDAVNAAVDGDILLLRSGVYYPISIAAKSLTLAAAPDAVVTLGPASKFNGSILTAEPPFSIASIGVQQSVVIRGVRLAQLRAVNCTGTLLFDQCVGVGYPAGIEITNCAAVAFEGCVLDGNDGTSFPNLPLNGPALDLSGSNVTLTRSKAIGGDALTTTQTISAPGSPGIRLGSGKLMLSASIAKGGKGQDGVCPSEGPGIIPAGIGGPGINILDPSSGAFAYASLLEGGPGGLGGCSPPISGPAVAGLVNLYTPLPGTSTFDFLVNSPVHEQQMATFLLKGAPGDVPMFLVSAVPAAAIMPSFHDALIAGAPFTIVALPALVAPTQSFSVPIPELGAGIEGVRLVVQTAFCSSGVPCVLGSAHALILTGDP